jgi:RNA polymerase sigma-70 factor (ECF subfamily)
MPSSFATTRWSQVSAIGGDEAAARSALAWLCERYWQPLLTHARRRGCDEHEAEDAVQGFFTRLLEKRDLSPDPARGRFRAYLLGALDHYLANARAHERALKRGGGRAHADLAASEPAHSDSPERAFARAWAQALLARVLARLEQEQRPPERFAVLRDFIGGNASAETYAQAGARIAMSEGAVKVAVYRLRQRYREILHEEVAETVASRDHVAIEAELRELLDALR